MAAGQGQAGKRACSYAAAVSRADADADADRRCAARLGGDVADDVADDADIDDDGGHADDDGDDGDDGGLCTHTVGCAPFCSTSTGKTLEGMEVSQSRKSGCTPVLLSRPISSTFSSSRSIQEDARWQFWGGGRMCALE